MQKNRQRLIFFSSSFCCHNKSYTAVQDGGSTGRSAARGTAQHASHVPIGRPRRVCSSCQVSLHLMLLSHVLFPLTGVYSVLVQLRAYASTSSGTNVHLRLGRQRKGESTLEFGMSTDTLFAIACLHSTSFSFTLPNRIFLGSRPCRWKSWQ